MNAIEFPTDAQLVIDRSPEFFTAAQALSDFIHSLPLTVEQNDLLVELIVKQVNVAERSGFTSGLGLGAKIVSARDRGEL